MFGERFFPDSYFAPRYFAKEGLTAVIISGPFLIDNMQLYIAGASEGEIWVSGSDVGEVAQYGLEGEVG